MKLSSGSVYRFVCNKCGKEAGSSPREDEALSNAREITRIENWKWQHPYWGLLCPKCKEENNV